MKSNIIITNKAGSEATVIDIEGVIGVPEELQFNDSNGIVSTYSSLRSLLERSKNNIGKEVIVNIRSSGGSVQDALLIYDYLVESGAVVTTRCFGYAASAATIIAQAASSGRREISANSLYLIHNSSCEAEGNSADMGSTIEMLTKTDERIASVYTSASGREASLYRNLMNENTGRGRWLSPDEVIAYGLADKIIEKSRITRRDRRLVRNLALLPLPASNPVDVFKRVWDKITCTLQEQAQDTTAGTQAANSAGIVAKENENPLRKTCMPTSTRPKEDPPVHEARLTLNQHAYLEDLYRLKNL